MSLHRWAPKRDDLIDLRHDAVVGEIDLLVKHVVESGRYPMFDRTIHEWRSRHRRPRRRLPHAPRVSPTETVRRC